jgi:hypothetical protein
MGIDLLFCSIAYSGIGGKRKSEKADKNLTYGGK